MTKCIIELNGLPGSGKTFLCEYLEKYFILAGYKTILLSEQMEKKTNTKRKTRILNMLRHIKISQFLVGIESFLRIQPLSFRRFPFVFLYWETCLEYNRFVKDKNSDILVADEGNIQRLLSIIFPGKISDKFIKKFIKTISNKNMIMIINCNLEIDQTLERLKIRNSRQSRVDRMTVKEKKQALLVQNKCLKDLRKCLSAFEWKKIIDVDTNNEENFEKLLFEIRNI